ncbi:MAG: MBL fold metallo-hydrolase, partial [Syntrophobacteraceae bacterium]
RSLSIEVLANMGKDESRSWELQKGNPESQIAERLLRRLLLLTEEFSSKNAELYKYLMRTKVLKEKDPAAVYVYGLQRFSSINPGIVRPSAFKMKGGGLFVVYKGQGIAIDPGLNFVENLYSEGFSIADIDCIIATHDHIDHIADVETLVSAFYRRWKIEGEEPRLPLKLIASPTVSLRYNYITNQNPKYFKKIELTDFGIDGDDGWITILNGVRIKSISVKHCDLGSPGWPNTLGFILEFDKKIKIGITSDTYFEEQTIGRFVKEDLSIFLVNINSSSFCELVSACFKKDTIQYEANPQIHKLKSFDEELYKQITYSLGFNPKEDLKHIPTLDWNELFPIASKPLLGEHLGLHGTLKAYEMFKSKSREKRRGKIAGEDRLFLICETNEEMGSFRHKVAQYIEQFLNRRDEPGPKALTSDIGLCIRVKPNDIHNNRPEIQVRCSQCSLSNDFGTDDMFHSLSEIREICIKYEEEGLFYLCHDHVPEGGRRKPDEYVFLERLERYQPFRHLDIDFT